MTIAHGSSPPRATSFSGLATTCASSRTATATTTASCPRASSTRCSKPLSLATRPASAASRRASDSGDVCRESHEGALRAACLHEEIQVRDRPAEAGCRIDRPALAARTGVRYGGLTMAKIPFEKSSGNVFADIAFRPAEAAELTAKSNLIIAIKDTIARRKLTQQEAARLCGTDQPTLSKVFRGRMESVTIDRLASWLTSLGRDVEIIV